MEALHDVVRAGKARYLGASSMYAWQFAKVQHAAANGWTPFVSMQNHYNLVYREEEREMIPLCRRPGRRRDPVEPAGPGPAGRQPGPRAARSARCAPTTTRSATGCTATTTSPWSTRSVEVAGERGVTPAQVALAWLLAQAGGDRADRRRDEAAAPRGRDRRGGVSLDDKEIERAGGAVPAAPHPRSHLIQPTGTAERPRAAPPFCCATAGTP